MDKKTKVIGALCMAGVAVLGGIGGAVIFPNDVMNPINTDLQDKVDAYKLEVKGVQAQLDAELAKPVIKEIETVIVTEEVINPINVGLQSDLALITQYLEDIEVFEDAAEVVESIKAEDRAITIAIEAIKKDFAVELEDADIVDDEDEVEIRTIYDDIEDIEIIKSDYDDDEYKFAIKVKIYDDDVEDTSKVWFTVEVEDGDSKIKKVELRE